LPGFFRRNRVFFASVFCLLLAAGLALRTSRERTRTDGLGRFFLEVIAPLAQGTSAVRRSVTGSWRGLAELARARDESRRLEAEVRRQAQQLDRLSEVELENARSASSSTSANRCTATSSPPASSGVTPPGSHARC